MLAGLGAATLSQGVAAAPELRLCINDTPVGGTAMRQRDQRAVMLLAERLQLTLRLKALPGRRCIVEVAAGRLDGHVGLSVTAQRLQMLRYPQRDGLPDEQLRLSRDQYHWYVRRDDRWAWNGERLSGAREPVVGAVVGYSVLDTLRDGGYRVSEVTGGTPAALRMLLRQRFDVAVLLAGEAEPELQAQPALAQQLMRLDPPVEKRNYYLVFSPAFHAANPVLARRIWAELPAVREQVERETSPPQGRRKDSGS